MFTTFLLEWVLMLLPSHCESGMVFAVNPTANETYDTFQVCSTPLTFNYFPVTDRLSPQANAEGTNTTSSSVTPSSTGSSPNPSASGYSSSGAAPAFGLSKLTGIISLVAIFAGSIL